MAQLVQASSLALRHGRPAAPSTRRRHSIERQRRRGACQHGDAGRVVLIVGGEATTFDSAGSETTFVVQ